MSQKRNGVDGGVIASEEDPRKRQRGLDPKDITITPMEDVDVHLNGKIRIRFADRILTRQEILFEFTI